MVEPIHTAVRGRARYRVEGLQGCSLLKDHLMIGLSSHEAVVEVSSSTVTGNLLVRFNSGNDFKAIAALIELLVAEYRAGVSRKPEAFRATDPARGAPAVRSRSLAPVAATGHRQGERRALFPKPHPIPAGRALAHHAQHRGGSQIEVCPSEGPRPS